MKLITALGLLLLSTPLWAQTGGYQVGQTVDNFTLPLTGNDKAVAIIFTNKHCPYSQLYKNRLQRLAAEYAGKGVKFLFISPAIGMEQGNKPRETGGTDLPYISDPDQRVSRQLGATKTPEVFVLQRQNGTLTLRYKGAIDDNPQLETGVREAYLQAALDAVLTNHTPAMAEKRATGCMIKRL